MVTPNAVTDICTYCGVQNPDLKPCPCLQAFYCNKECQHKHWRSHLTVCSIAGQKREEQRTNQQPQPQQQQQQQPQQLPLNGNMPPQQLPQQQQQQQHPISMVEMQDLGFINMGPDNQLLANHMSQIAPKNMARIGQVAQAIPHGLLVRVVCELAEEYPQLGDVILQRLEKAEFNLHMQQQYLVGGLGQQMQMPVGNPGMLPSPEMHIRKEGDMWHQGWGPAAGPFEKKHSNPPSAPLGARKPRPHNNDTEQMLCSKHNTTRSKKHLNFNGNDWECVPGFHCLESRPTTPPQEQPSGEQGGEQVPNPTPPQ